MLRRQRDGRLHRRLFGEYTRSACLSECEAWLHAKFIARIGTGRWWRLVQDIRRHRTCDNAGHHALAKSSYARIFSGTEFRAIAAWRYAGRCHQLFGIYLGSFAICASLSMCLILMEDLLAGVITSVHRIGDDYIELVGENDWIARRVSAYGWQRARWWCHSDHCQWSDTGLFVGWTHTGDTAFSWKESRTPGFGNKCPLGRLLFGSGAFKCREGCINRYGGSSALWVRWNLTQRFFFDIQGLVRMRFIESDDNLSMRGDALEDAIRDDIKLGLVPFWVSFF